MGFPCRVGVTRSLKDRLLDTLRPVVGRCAIRLAKGYMIERNGLTPERLNQ